MSTELTGQFRCLCGGKTLVIDSRAKPQYVRRRRHCLKCQRRFTTKEQVVGWDNKAKVYK